MALCAASEAMALVAPSAMARCAAPAAMALCAVPGAMALCAEPKALVLATQPRTRKPRGRPRASARWDGNQWVLDPDAAGQAAEKLVAHIITCKDRKRATRTLLKQMKPALFEKAQTKLTEARIHIAEDPVDGSIKDSRTECNQTRSANTCSAQCQHAQRGALAPLARHTVPTHLVQRGAL